MRSQYAKRFFGALRLARVCRLHGTFPLRSQQRCEFRGEEAPVCEIQGWLISHHRFRHWAVHVPPAEQTGAGRRAGGYLSAAGRERAGCREGARAGPDGVRLRPGEQEWSARAAQIIRTPQAVSGDGYSERLTGLSSCRQAAPNPGGDRFPWRAAVGKRSSALPDCSEPGRLPAADGRTAGDRWHGSEAFRHVPERIIDRLVTAHLALGQFHRIGLDFLVRDLGQ